MPAETKPLKKSGGQIIPQVFDPVADDWVAAKGAPEGYQQVAVPDGQDVALGATTAVESAAGNGTAIGILKNLRTRLANLDIKAGQLETLLGALDAVAVTDPAAASAALTALVRGLLKQMQGAGTGSLPVNISGSLPSFAAIPSMKIDQTTPGTTNAVTVSGSLASVACAVITASTTVVKTNGTETSRFTVPAGKIWRLNGLEMTIPIPTDGTSGTHKVEVMLQGKVALMRNSQPFNKLLTYTRGVFVTDANLTEFTTGVLPSDKTALAGMIKGLVIMAGESLDIIYSNLTDKDQTNNRVFKLSYLQEAITS